MQEAARRKAEAEAEARRQAAARQEAAAQVRLWCLTSRLLILATHSRGRVSTYLYPLSRDDTVIYSSLSLSKNDTNLLSLSLSLSPP